jgi:hypothetical protein
MRSNRVRVAAIMILLSFLVVGSVIKTYSQRDGNEIDVQSFHWHLAPAQIARVCLAKPPTSDGPPPTETISLNFVTIKNQLGQTAFERALPVPIGEMRCTDVTELQLENVGFSTEPLPGRTFLIFLSGPTGTSRNQNVGPSEQMVWSIETIDVNTAQTQMYQTFHWRFATNN